MTIGTKGVASFQPTGASVTTQVLDWENWNGTDGKFVVIDGFSRIKYNSYTKTRIYRVRTRKSNKSFIDNGYNMSGNNTLTSNDTIKLNNKLISKVRAHDLNVAVFAAEGKKTISLVKNSVLTVGGALVDVKHGNMKRAMQRLGIFKSTFSRANSGKFFVNKKVSLSPEDISSRWLELQYGWKPLLEDTYNACKAYEALTEGPRTYYYKASTSRNVHFDSSNHASYICPTSGKLTQKILLEMREVLPGGVPRSLGLEDPLTVAWELVPYSFVVDWFIPIGPWLNAAHSTPLLTGRWYKTTAREYVNSRSTIVNPTYYEGSTINGEWLYIVRTAGTGNLSTPLPSFKRLEDALSPLHVTNAIALVTSRLLGSKSHK